MCQVNNEGKENTNRSKRRRYGGIAFLTFLVLSAAIVKFVTAIKAKRAGAERGARTRAPGLVGPTMTATTKPLWLI